MAHSATRKVNSNAEVSRKEEAVVMPHTNRNKPPALPPQIKRLQGLFGEVDPQTGKMVTGQTIAKAVKRLGAGGKRPPDVPGAGQRPKPKTEGGLQAAPVASVLRQQPIPGGRRSPPLGVSGRTVPGGSLPFDPFKNAVARRKRRGPTPNTPGELRSRAQLLRQGNI